MHSLNHLSAKGRGAIICFPGIFYRKGAEKTIRQYFIDNNFIEAIIALPENLFFGTSIATCILVISKNKVDNKTLFIDATVEFKKATNNNILTTKNIEKILDKLKNKEDENYFAKLVTSQEIAENDYNLSVSTYVEKEDTREVIDIKALNQEIKETVAKIDQLRKDIDLIVRSIENE